MKVLRCCLVDENGIARYVGPRMVVGVSTDLVGFPITHIVVDKEDGEKIIWPANRVYYFNTNE